MNIRLDGRNALVTGASRGIGRAVALELASAGANLALTARHRADLEGLAAEVKALGVAAIVLPCDLADLGALEAMALEAQNRLGQIDLLVNNAGITQGIKFGDLDLPLWERTLQLNLTAAMRLTQLLIAGMAQRRWGRVVNIASIAGKAGLRYSAAYNASKHALLGLTKSLALDFAQHGVTVNAVCPGWVSTEMAETTLENIIAKTGRSRTEALQSLLKDVPIKRMIEPAEVAALVVFLASEQAKGITAQAYNIDGGLLSSG